MQKLPLQPWENRKRSEQKGQCPEKHFCFGIEIERQRDWETERLRDRTTHLIEPRQVTTAWQYCRNVAHPEIRPFFLTNFKEKNHKKSQKSSNISSQRSRGNMFAKFVPTSQGSLWTTSKIGNSSCFFLNVLLEKVSKDYILFSTSFQSHKQIPDKPPFTHSDPVD